MVGTRRKVSGTIKNADLKLARIESLLAKIDYPGYSFHLIQIDDGQIFVRMRKHNVKNAQGTGHFIELQHYAFASSGDEEEECFVRAVFEAILSLEIHEVHEQFRYKDAQVYNPHKFLGDLKDG